MDIQKVNGPDMRLGTLEDIYGLSGNSFQGAIGNLHQGDAVGGVFDGLADAQGLSLEGIGNGHAGGIIGRLVDPQPGGQPPQGFGQRFIIFGHDAVGV